MSWLVVLSWIEPHVAGDSAGSTTATVTRRWVSQPHTFDTLDHARNFANDAHHGGWVPAGLDHSEWSVTDPQPTPCPTRPTTATPTDGNTSSSPTGGGGA